MLKKATSIKVISAIMMELDSFTSKLACTSRTAKFRPCSTSKHANAMENAIEVFLYFVMRLGGQAGDHTTNCSSTQVTFEVEFIFIVLLSSY
jgi:hypothetical protein